MGKLQEASKKSARQPSIETSSAFEFHPSRAELYQMGKGLREKCPRSSHAAWPTARDRPDPIQVLEEANQGRIPELIPIRYGRMLQSPFTFYRGAALNMAADLAGTPTSGLFLGWVEGQQGRQFYVRQLKDMKVKPLVEVFTPSVMQQYGELCGWTLARAHARSSEPAKISGYLGKNDAFDEAIADFSISYADQSERDHEVLMNAVRAGRLEVFVEQD